MVRSKPRTVAACGAAESMLSCDAEPVMKVHSFVVPLGVVIAASPTAGIRSAACLGDGRWAVQNCRNHCNAEGPRGARSGGNSRHAPGRRLRSAAGGVAQAKRRGQLRRAMRRHLWPRERACRRPSAARSWLVAGPSRGRWRDHRHTVHEDLSHDDQLSPSGSVAGALAKKRLRRGGGSFPRASHIS
jgi:hypothetical protein